MILRRSSWIRGKTHIVTLLGGGMEGYVWHIHININVERGIITNTADNSTIIIIEPEKVRLRSNDRQWFVRVCGKEYMHDKEVDHAWGSTPVWTRIVSPMENGGRQTIHRERPRSFVETEEWLEELYQGKRR